MAAAEPAQRVIQAIRDGRGDQVQVLVESNPDLAAARDPSGISAVVLALYHGQVQVAQWLASRRRDLDVFEAACLGHDDRVSVLLADDPSVVHSVSPDGFTALALASFFGRLPVVRLLIARGADVNAVGPAPGRFTPLTGAVTGRHADVVRELLGGGADANYRYDEGLTPLHVAAVNGSSDIVRALVEAGARVDAEDDKGRTPLDYAREKGQSQIVELLS